MRPGVVLGCLIAIAGTGCANPVAALLTSNGSTTAAATSSTGAGSSGSTSGGSSSTGSTSSTSSTSTGGGSTSGSSSSSSSSSRTGTSTGGTFFSCNLRDGGLFADPITLTTGLAYSADWHPIDVGDLNGDGNLDLVVTDEGTGDVVVLFGNGDGTFQQPVHSQVPAVANAPYPEFLGPIDLRIAPMGWPSVPSVVLWDGDSASVLVESVQPSGELATTAVLDAGQQGYWGFVQVADFNGDGIPDCAGTPEDAGVAVFLGNDAGGYSPAAWLSNVWCAGHCVGDFNEDGILDLIVLSTDSSGTLGVHLGLGDGTFSAAAIATGILGTPDQIPWWLGDLNEDGHLDVIVGIAVSPWYTVLLGRGDGTFSTGVAPAFPDGYVEALVDVNGDGHLDAAGEGNDDSIYVALGNGDGTFQLPPATVVNTGSVWKVVVGDVNNDGRPDLIASGWSDANVQILLNNCR